MSELELALFLKPLVIKEAHGMSQAMRTDFLADFKWLIGSLIMVALFALVMVAFELTQRDTTTEMTTNTVASQTVESAGPNPEQMKNKKLLDAVAGATKSTGAVLRSICFLFVVAGLIFTFYCAANSMKSCYGYVIARLHFRNARRLRDDDPHLHTHPSLARTILRLHDEDQIRWL